MINRYHYRRMLIKIVRNRIFDFHLSPDWRQMAIENTVSSNFDPQLLIVKGVFDCCLSSI